MITPSVMQEIGEGIDAIIAEPTGNFVKLAEAARLNPCNAFAYADLTEVDLSDCVLAGYDFTKSDLRGMKWNENTDFTGAVTIDAQFDPGVRGVVKGLPAEKLFRVFRSDAPPFMAPTREEALKRAGKAERHLDRNRLQVREGDDWSWCWE